MPATIILPRLSPFCFDNIKTWLNLLFGRAAETKNRFPLFLATL